MYSDQFSSKLSLFFLVLATAFNSFGAIFAASALSLLALGGGGIVGVVFVLAIMIVAAMIVMLPAMFALYFHRNGKYALCIALSLSIISILAALITVTGVNSIITTLQFPLIFLR